MNLKSTGVVITLFLLFSKLALNGQTTSYQWFYRVYFRDKGNDSPSNYSAGDLLSPRAIARREKFSIPVPDFRDIPVQSSYINEIIQMGLKLHSTSRWMNTGLFKSESEFNVQSLLNLPYVKDVKLVKDPWPKGSHNGKLDFEIHSDSSPYDLPITMVNGYALHNSGFTGTNVLIAVLDGGFAHSEYISSIAEMRNRNGIKGTHDFINNNLSVYHSATHGTAVLSILAGNIPGKLHGTAPGADYLLINTEDIATEFPCEEDFWAMGAEFADSTGADIISSSLGYFNFFDASMNYKITDLDGNTAFVTQVADIAASKGILVVVSAGNERDNYWKHIVFPSDGDSVIAAGAVDAERLISVFSSAGPSADGRIKPDNAAMGVNVTVQTDENLIGGANGTSFSCPVISGMAACLMQAVPEASNADIINVLHSSADRFSFPDTLYGYGIPDMAAALVKLQDIYRKPQDDDAIISPNPNAGSFEIFFRQKPGDFTIEIFSLTGKVILRKNYTGYQSRSIFQTDLQKEVQGIYLLRITTRSQTIVRKIIKLNTLK